jgi:hypothetical protein
VAPLSWVGRVVLWALDTAPLAVECRDGRRTTPLYAALAGIRTRPQEFEPEPKFASISDIAFVELMED